MLMVYQLLLVLRVLNPSLFLVATVTQQLSVRGNHLEAGNATKFMANGTPPACIGNVLERDIKNG